jgi:3-methyladenine DNA glycosylase AlkD
VAAIDDLRRELAEAADPERAAGLRRYLRMVPGGYGDGDDVLGIPVPVQRRIAGRHWRAMTAADAAALLEDGLHEERLTALLVLVRRFRAGDDAERRACFDVVLANLDHIDNWDLVDSVAPYVVGPWLADKDRSVLDRLAASPSVWARRTAVLATFAFIRDDDYVWSLRLAERLLDDPHDLIHKAVGWMLREVGNRDRASEEAFLRRHHAAMPRVMLRYAIEKFEPERRRQFLTGDLPP